MKKLHLKFLGAECLYMLLNIFVACVSVLLQFIGRKYDGAYASFISIDENYSYNIFFYIFGWCIYLLYLFFSYKFFFSKKIDVLNTGELWFKILYIFAALLFSVFMFPALLSESLIILGWTTHMTPEILLSVTLFGFPIATAIYMITIAIIKFKTKK